MSNLKLPVKIGYADGSGEDYLTDANDNPLAVVRWGCGCCKPNGPLTAEEQHTLETLRDAVNAVNPVVGPLSQKASGGDKYSGWDDEYDDRDDYDE